MPRFLSLLLLLSALPCAAIDFAFSRLTVADGLADNTVRTVFQDSHGFVWLGTYGGLSRYDGYNVVNVKADPRQYFNLQEPQVRSIHEDGRGLLWVLSSNDGVCCLDPLTCRFVRFYAEGEPHTYRHLLLAADGAVWLYGENGARRVAPGPVREGALASTHYGKGALPSPRVVRVADGGAGRTLIATAGGLVAWQGGKMAVIDRRPYQWFAAATAGRTLMVAFTGDVLCLDARGRLTRIGRIDGVKRENDLPGAFTADGQWVLATAHGTYQVDLHTLSLARAPEAMQLAAWQVKTDNMGGHWLYNGTGTLFRYRRGALIPLRVQPAATPDKAGRYAVSCDSRGRAWIATGAAGAYCYDPATGALQHLDAAATGLTGDELLCVQADRHGGVWLGTNYAGVVRLRTTSPLPGSEALTLPAQGDANVRAVLRLASGEVLVATRAGQLHRYSPDMRTCHTVAVGASVYDMKQTRRWGIVLATRDKGLFTLDGDRATPSPLNAKLGSSQLFSVAEDAKGRLWVGTFGQGIDVFAPDGRRVAHLLTATYGQRRIRDLLADTRGRLWAATNEGVWLIAPDRAVAGKGGLTPYNATAGQLGANEVHCLAEDAAGRIWVGEGGTGISIIDLKDGPHITRLSESTAIGNANVQAFVRENDRYMWATTLTAALRIDTRALTVKAYTFNSAARAAVHNPHSAALLADGRLLFGAQRGAYFVNPRKLPATRPARRPVITEVYADDQPVAVADRGVVLPHDQNTVELRFSSFDFDVPHQTRFRYRLEPHDKAWGHPTAAGSVVFGDLAPGHYTFRVQACDASGVWSETATLRLTVRHPWWATWWADLIYVLLIAGAAALVLLVVRRMDALRAKVRLEKQLTDYKLDFFTNISHEFRTPLTLIQVAIEKLQLSGGGQSALAMLDKNAKRMARLIDELLTFRKVEKGKLTLRPEPTEVVGFVRDIYDTFADGARAKRIAYTWTADADTLQANIDRGAVEKMATNLLSNALKYTLEGGTVGVSLAHDAAARRLTLTVRDNGVGVAPEKKAQLFTRFMQSAVSRDSIGVGLHLTAGLAALHGGTVEHADNPGGGSVFVITLPTDLPASADLPREELGMGLAGGLTGGGGFLAADSLGTQPTACGVDLLGGKKAAAPGQAAQAKRLLVIDDDTDIREMLAAEFAAHFAVVTASDGASGLRRAQSEDVDLVVCDVMMPDMSGFEVTRRLKENFATSHIPVIQLTALADAGSEMEGIRSGADAYVTKPFRLRTLILRAQMLIAQREALFQKFSQSPMLMRPTLPVADRDKAFTDKLAEVVRKQMANADYTVDDFAADMAMGRTLFFRKVKGTTGYAPKEYLRVMRMKRAAELLLTTGLSVSEIAYKVGASDPAYFNKCFKAQFGKAPSVYQRENAGGA